MRINTKEIPPRESDLMFDAVRLPAQVDWAIGMVIDYLWRDEWKAYHELPQRERRGHIFEILNHVRVWRSFPLAKLEEGSRPVKDDPFTHVREAAAALLNCWDELRQAEILLGKEISTEDLAVLTAGFDTARDMRKLSDEDLNRFLARKR